MRGIRSQVSFSIKLLLLFTSMASIIPPYSRSKSPDEIIQRVTREHDTYVLSHPEAVICLTRAAADLTRHTLYSNLYAPEVLRRDHDVSEDKIASANAIATRLVNTGNIIIFQSSLTDDLADICNKDINNEDDEIDPVICCLLHYLTCESGWILTALGGEDCVYLGDDVFCLIKNPLSSNMALLLNQFNDCIGEEAEGVEFGTRYQFRDRFGKFALNPLDKLAWSDPRSTPHDKGCTHGVNDEELEITSGEQYWSETFPVDITDNELLQRVYAKLDSVTTYKNHLALEVVRLNEKITQLKRDRQM